MRVYIKLSQEIPPISLFDANIGTETRAVIDRATAKPAEARTIYAKEYVNGNRYLAAASYDRAFNKYYEAGKKGMSFSDIKRSSRDIKADSARRIYEAGRKATENESKRQSKYKQTAEYKSRSEARTEANTKAKKKGGVIRSYAVDKKISRLQRQQLRVLDEWARQEGITIRVVESLSEKIKLDGKIINGLYDGGNVITIALDGKNMLTSTAGHELYHMIKELAPEHAEAFRAFVVDHLKEAGEYDSVFGDYERRYKNTYKADESFKAKIEEEIVADHCFEALTNKKQWEKFAGEHKSIAEKIIDFIREFVAMISKAFDKYFVHDNAYIRDSVIGEVEYMNKIADMLWTGVDKAVENYRSGAVNQSGETKYSQSDVDKTSGDNIKYTQGGESNGKLGQTISDEVQGSTVRAGNAEHTFSVDQKEKRRRKVAVDGRTAEVLSSSEETAEQKRIRQQLKAEEGQDVYFTTDGTYLVTDSAVFMPADIFEDDGFTLSDRQASFSQDRFNDLVSTYSVKNGGAGSQNYSKGYVTYIFPSDFLALTTTNEQHIVEDARNKYYKLDVDALKNERQTPFLRIDLQTGEVTGHEGRHRMALLRDAGIEKVAIAIEADSEAGKYNTQKLNKVNISGQEFGSGKASGTAVLDEVIPLSPKYRNEVKEKFVDVDSDIKYSVSDNDRLNELQSEYRELEKKVDKIKASDEYKRLLDIISTGEGDALDEAVKEYGKFTHSSGLYAVTKRMSEITGEQKDLRAKIDSANEQSRDEFMRSVDDLTDRQKAEYAQKAVDTFGTTERVDLASYILTNGEMLDFSEGQGYRIKDHREISEILDMPDSAEYSDSLIYFMNMGNIRMQTYGIDISAAPNAEQISRLRDVIPEIMKDNDEFSVDFSKKNGYSAGSVTYTKGTATSKILSDINEFFESGTVPVYESEYGEFRYSVSKSFEDQIDSVLNNTFDPNNHIYMGNTPNSLQSILHLQNRPMLITPTHVYTMMVSEAQAKADGRYVKGRNYHDLGKDILLGLPKALEKPLFLIKSSAKQNDLRIIAVTSLTDKHGVNVVAAIEPDGKGKLYNMTLDSNVVLSGYGKSNVLNYVLNAKKEGRILYASENNNRLGKNRPGVQFPDHAFTADYINSLSQYRETVNKYYAQNDKEYLSNSNKYQNYVLSDDQRASVSDAGMRLTDDTELSSLLREQAYKEEIERLKGEFVKSKRMGGKGKNRLVQADINRIARDIISEYSSKIDFSTLRDELTGLYELMDNIEMQGSADYAEFVKLSNDIAKSVIASSYVDITDQSAEKYKAAMRSYRLTPSLQDVAELEDMFGTFGAAYRQYGRKLNMRAQGTPGALHIDEVWEDLCDSVPFLDRDAVSTQDMWRNLIEVRDSLDEKNGFNPYITDGDLTANEAAGALGADILERFNEVRADTTFADRAQQRVDLRFPIVVMRIKIFSLTGCSDIINPSPNRTLSRNPLTARPTAHTLVLHDVKQCKQVYQRQCIMHKIVFVCKRCGLKAHSGRTESHLQGILERLGQNRQPLVSWQMILERRDRRLCP